jgi:hypothetical protein
MEIKNQPRSGGIGESKIVYMDLYTNRSIYSIKIEDSGN